MTNGKNDHSQLLRNLQDNQSTESLEQLLYNLLFNPVRLQRQRITLDEQMNNDVLFELREGTIINEAGCLEEVQELVINTNTLADGNPMNIYGIAKCQTCGAIVKDTSLGVCSCGKTCCLVTGCGHYARFNNRLYCSWWHKFLGFLGLSAR